MAIKKNLKENSEFEEFPWTYFLSETFDMGRSEEWFWNCEPKKFVALIKMKKEREKEKLKTLAIYVGCDFTGKDFEIMEPNEVEGIDKPVSQDALRSLY